MTTEDRLAFQAFLRAFQTNTDQHYTQETRETLQEILRKLAEEQ